MKRTIISSTLADLRAEAYELYETAYEICNERMVEDILLRNGATEDDSGNWGFFTGVSQSQLENMIAELQDLINRTVGDEIYSITLTDSEIELIIKALDSFSTYDSREESLARIIRNKLI